jgi:membrane protease YdiL (CAAX protease family)
MIVVSGVWRSTHFVPARWSLGAGESLLLFVALPVLGAIGAAVATRLAPQSSDQSTVSVEGMLWSIGFAAVLPIAAVVLFLARHETVAPAGTRLNSALLGAAAMVAVWFPIQAIGAAVASLQLALGGPAAPAEGHATLQLLGQTPLDVRRWLLIVGVVIVVPTIEEIMFRGALLGALRRVGLSAWSAIGLSATLFALVHVPALVSGAVAPGLAMLFVLGIALGWCAARTGSLAAPITAHALFNAVNLLQSLR